MADIEVLENEILEETPPDVVDTPADPVENMENIQEPAVDVPSDNEMETTGEVEILSPDVIEEEEPPADIFPEDTIPEELEENQIVEEEIISDNSISGNSIVSDGSTSSPVSYTANYITMQQEEPDYFEWQKPFSDFTTSEMLLFLIFLLLLVRFVHDIFKGSHWFKG